MKLLLPVDRKTFKPSKAGKSRSLISACCLSLLLSACGGSGGGENGGETNGETIVQPTTLGNGSGIPVFGLGTNAPIDIPAPLLVTVRHFNSVVFSDELDVRALRYADDRTMQRYIDFYGDQWDSDTCTIPGSEPDTGGTSGGSTGGSAPYVSAGQSVVVNTPAGTWFTIPQGDDLRYRATSGIPGPIPSGATLSIPGDDFPTVSAYPLFQPAVPVRSSPELGVNIDLNTQYSWTPDGDSTTGILLYFQEVDADGNFIAWSDMSCEMTDDGQFTLPIEALSFISASQNSFQVSYVRQLTRLDLINGIAFYQRSRVEEF